jgi:hypothetical protein
VPAPASLPAAVLDHAARHPEEPWLFRSEGWDWLWHSWGEIAGRVVQEAGRLASLAPGTRIAVPDVPHPDSIVLDLAAQAAGLTPVPAEAGNLERPARESSPSGSLSRGERERKANPDNLLAPLPWERGWGEDSRVDGPAAQADLLAAAQRIQDEIPPSPKPGREILVAGRSLFDPADRAVLAWAIAAGAALLLEPHPGARAATAVWARSTVFHGTAEEIAHLRRLAETGPGRRWWRLRVVFAVGDEPLAEGDAAFWRDRGVKVSEIAAERRNRGI